MKKMLLVLLAMASVMTASPSHKLLNYAKKGTLTTTNLGGLLLHNAKINKQDQDGETALHIMIEKVGTELDPVWPMFQDAKYPHLFGKDFSVIKMLIARGARVSKKNSSGKNALHCAQNFPALKLLLETSKLKSLNHAINATDNAGRVPLYYAIHFPVVKRDSGKIDSSPFMAVKALVEHGDQVNQSHMNLIESMADESQKQQIKSYLNNHFRCARSPLIGESTKLIDPLVGLVLNYLEDDVPEANVTRVRGIASGDSRSAPAKRQKR